MRFSCERCGQHFQGDATWTNQLFDCPACGERIAVPADAPEPEPMRIQIKPSGEIAGRQSNGPLVARPVRKRTAPTGYASPQAMLAHRRLSGVYGVAKAQKGLLVCVLGHLLIMLTLLCGKQGWEDKTETYMRWILLGGGVSNLALLAVELYFVYRLACLLCMGMPITWVLGLVIGQCLPLLSIILLMVLCKRATEAIRLAGYKVGLMGANLGVIRRTLEEVAPAR